MTGPTQQQSLGEEKSFFRLLAFLGHDQPEDGLTREQVMEQRGRIYNGVHERLKRLFAFRGSAIPEELASETLNRAQKVLSEKPDGWEREEYQGDPVHWILAIARYIRREIPRKWPNPDPLPDKLPDNRLSPEKLDVKEIRDRCVRTCIGKLHDSDDRKIILGYYTDERRAKIDHRRLIAKRFNLSVNALRIRCCRIREKLRPCLEKCIKLGLQEEMI